MMCIVAATSMNQSKHFPGINNDNKKMWCDVICCCHLRWERFLIWWWETKRVSCLSLSRFQLRASLARVATCSLAENSWMPSWTSALQLLQVKVNSHRADQIWLDLLCHWKQRRSKPTSAFPPQTNWTSNGGGRNAFVERGSTLL